MAEQQLKVGEVIGKGSFGIVHKASYYCHPIAVKCLVQPVPDKADQRFIFECKLMNLIRHANIVLCLGLIDCKPYPFLMMELMDRNLQKYLEAAPIRFCLQVDITLNILQAIAYLHSSKIIHRDLSSANVLMKGNIAKISDFGMACRFSDISQSDLTWCPGTAAYMPPEAFSRPPDYNQSIDVFSAGVLLIQTQTRKYPDINRRHDDIAKYAPGNPLREIAQHCLSDDKEKRPSADILCEKLMAIQESEMYLLDKSIFDQNLHLSRHLDIPQMFKQSQATITEAKQVISTLQIKNAELVQKSDALESRIFQLQRANQEREREMIQYLQASLVNCQQTLARLSG